METMPGREDPKRLKPVNLFGLKEPVSRLYGHIMKKVKIVVHSRCLAIKLSHVV